MTSILAFLPPPGSVEHWSDFVGSDWVQIVSNLIGAYAELLTLSIVVSLLSATGKVMDDA